QPDGDPILASDGDSGANVEVPAFQLSLLLARARLLGYLGNRACSAGKYDKADWLVRKALVAAEQALGPDHPELTALLNNLGVIHKYQGRYREAGPPYWRAARNPRTTY